MTSSPDLQQRRAYLKTIPNPDKHIEYLVSLKLSVYAQEVSLRFVPHQHLITTESFKKYLTALTPADWSGIEDLAITLLGDVNNVVIPRWVHVAIHADGDAQNNHQVVIEDHQPGWENDTLMARLTKI